MPVPLYDLIKTEVSAYIARIKAARQSDAKLSLQELFQLGFEAAATLVRLAQVPGYTGPEKKAAVILAAMQFHDEVIQPLDLPGPDWLIDPIVRQLYEAAVNAGVEVAVKLFWQIGVFSTPTEA